MRITLIHNPKAGDARHGKDQLMAALAEAGHHATYQSTKDPGLKKALKQPADLVLAAGGDGTIGKVAFRLIDSGIPLSVLPLGTANNLARALGFVASPEEIIARLEGGKKEVFDVGLATGPWGERHFFEGVGGGLLADYVWAAKKEEKKNGKAEKLSKEQQASGVFLSSLHDADANKETAFIKSIETANYLNEAKQGAESTLTAILGREAAEKRQEKTWEEIVRTNEKLDPALNLPQFDK